MVNDSVTVKSGCLYLYPCLPIEFYASVHKTSCHLKNNAVINNIRYLCKFVVKISGWFNFYLRMKTNLHSAITLTA